MKVKKILVRSLLMALFLALAVLVFYCWTSFPIISGYGSKILCSAVFTAGRDEQQVRQQDLGNYMMKLANFKVDYTDSSVTGSVFGFAKRKAIYRSGLGCTLVSGLSESEIRSQHMILARQPSRHTDTIPWPMGDKLSGSFPSGVDSSKLKAAVGHVFLEKDTILPVRTRAVVVLYNGQLICERYASGFSATTKLAGWSMTKTVTGALTGLLATQGKIFPDKPAPVPEWAAPNDPRHDITLTDLLHQRSGLKFDEVYSRLSDATRMLFEKADMGAYTASRPLKEQPGAVFYYSSGNSNIISRAIRQSLGDAAYYRFPYEQLFFKLGMYSAVLEPDASGTFVGSSYMYATARDWARFGLLYLNDGFYNGEQILPAEWIAKSIKPATADSQGYGFQIWLNCGTDTTIRRFPSAPADMYYADGFESQLIFIIPSKKLVIVRLGLTQHNNFNGDDFLREILSAFP